MSTVEPSWRAENRPPARTGAPAVARAVVTGRAARPGDGHPDGTVPAPLLGDGSGRSGFGPFAGLPLPPDAPRYTAGACAVLRIPALAADRYTVMLADCPPGRPDWAYAHRAFLDETWRTPHVPPALRHAAPSLLAALEDVPPAPGSRAALALDRYVNRMSTRPTPFGLLASVAGVPFAAGRDIRLDGPPEPRPRPRVPRPGVPRPGGTAPAAGPLADTTLLVAADLAHELDGHLWLEPRGGGSPVWLRGSAPALALLRAAHRPEEVATLVARLSGGPAAGDDTEPGTAAARSLVAAMVRLGFLRRVAVTAPPTRAGTDRVPVSGAAAHVDAVAAVTAPAGVDPRVAQLAELASSLLVMVGRGSRYPRYLARAADAFTAHYGEGARVPVLEVVHTLRALRALTEPEEAEYDPRDALLAGLVAEALAHRRPVRELDDPLVARLAGYAGASAAGPPLPGADICLRVALGDDGEWQAALSGFGAAPAGTGYGRFTDVLDTATRAALRDSFRAQEAAAPGRLFVELSYRAGPAAVAHVAARDRWRTWELPVDTAPTVPPHRVIAPRDVLVAVESGRFELLSARLGRRLYITQSSAVSLRLAPPVCRFLLDASANRFSHPAPFDWGAAARGPFLPRLSRGPLVVSPARWRLRRTDLDGEFGTAVRAWAETWMVPRHVRLVRAAEGLLLDLRSAVSLAHLRAALDRTGPGRADAGVVLEEVVPAPGGEVVADPGGGRYVLEAVVPVTAAHPVELPDPDLPVSTGSSSPRTAGHRPKLPGSDWLALHLSLPHRLQSALIAGQLPELRAGLAARHGADRLFFVRYADPGDELRIRVRCAAGRRGAALDELLGWAHRAGTELPVADLAVRTYRRETDRYGGPALIDAAEALFDADSAAVAEVLARRAATPLPWPVLTAATLDRIAGVLLPDPAERRALAARLADSRAASAEHRAYGARLWELRSDGGPAGSAVAQVAARWAEDGTAYAYRLGERWPGTSGGDRRLRATASLLHLHANRMGLDRAGERVAFGLWRRLLERDAAHTRAGGRRAAAADQRRKAAP